MSERIVVLGGTFNPLSKAHISILRQAKKEVKASKMIFLPTGDTFLHDWKKMNDKEILPTSLRLSILEEYCRRNKNTYISRCEIEKITMKTYDSLNYIKSEYKDCEIYFICGSEKITELGRWYKIDDLLKEFHVIIFKRNHDDIKKLSQDFQLYKNYPDSFIFSSSKDDIQNISSTMIRVELNKDGKIDERLTYKYIIKLIEEYRHEN